MKRVLLLLPGAFTGVGGIEMYCRQVVRAFLELAGERGFEVKVLILNDKACDVDGRYVPTGAKDPRCFERHTVLFGATTLALVGTWRPDLVVFGHVHFGRLGLLAKSLWPAARHWYLVYGIEVWSPLAAIIRKGLAVADRVLSISDFSARELEANGGVPASKIALLPCALDPVWQGQYAVRSEDPVPADNGHPRLLTVARLARSERYKGIESVLAALPAVARAVPKVTYDVVGDGDDRPRLEGLATELGLSSRVRFQGRLWPDRLAAAYRNCTLFVMPSSKEGFGIVFLEAALFGKPSLGGRHGGTPEVIEDGVTGLLCERENVDSIARAITRLLTDDAERARMGEAARRRLDGQFTYGSFRANVAQQLATA